MPIDTVIAAIGQIPEVQFAKDLGLRLSRRGTIEISPDSTVTNIEGVFAGGTARGYELLWLTPLQAGRWVL